MNPSSPKEVCMNCPKCNSIVDAGSAFCSECGCPLTPAAAPQPQPQPQQYQQPQYQQPQYQQPQYQQPQYQQPQYQQPQYQQPQYQQPQQQSAGGSVPASTVGPNGQQLGMNWFKFIIYFQLFASCAINLYNGIRVLTGAHYSGMAKLVYSMFKGLKAVDILFGLVFIALAAGAIFVRFQLSGFKAMGPKLYLGLLIAACAASVAYVIAVVIVLRSRTGVAVGSLIATPIIQVLVTGTMVVVNYIYFKNRKHLFTN